MTLPLHNCHPQITEEYAPDIITAIETAAAAGVTAIDILKGGIETAKAEGEIEMVQFIMANRMEIMFMIVSTHMQIT